MVNPQPAADGSRIRQQRDELLRKSQTVPLNGDESMKLDELNLGLRRFIDQHYPEHFNEAGQLSPQIGRQLFQKP